MNNIRFVTRVTCLFVYCATAVSLPVSVSAETVPEKEAAPAPVPATADKSDTTTVQELLAAQRFTQCREYLEHEKARLSASDYNYWLAKSWLKEEQSDELRVTEEALKETGAAFSSRGSKTTLEDMPPKLRNAMTFINLAINASPQRSDLYRLRSEIYSFWNMDAPAIIDASKAIEVEPKNPGNYISRARAWYDGFMIKPSAIANGTDSQLRARLLDISKLLENEQNRAMKKEALSDINAAIELNSKEGHFYSFRSKILQSLEAARNDVLADQTRAIERDPQNAKYYHDRAYTWQWLTPPDFEKALSDADKAIELEPHQSSHRMLRADCLLALHRWDEVDAEYVILDKMCDGGWYSQQKADAKFAMGKLDEAIKIWELNKDSTSLTKAAYASLRLYDPDRAIKLCDRAFELEHGPQLQAHWIKALALADDGQNSLALKEARLTLKIAKDAYPSDFNYAPRFFPAVTKKEIEDFSKGYWCSKTAPPLK